MDSPAGPTERRFVGLPPQGSGTPYQTRDRRDGFGMVDGVARAKSYIITHF